MLDKKLTLDLGRETTVGSVSSRAAGQRNGARYPASNLRRRDGFEIQENAVDDLLTISQPEGVPFDELPGFTYSPEAGYGITVYIIDTGIDESDQVCIPI